jgi:hypothetical protein
VPGQLSAAAATDGRGAGFARAHPDTEQQQGHEGASDPADNSAVTGLTMAATQARPARMAVAMIMRSIAAAGHWPLPLAIVGLHCSRTNGVTYHLNGR